MAILDDVQNAMKGFFPEKLGIRMLDASKGELRAEVEVTRDLCTLPGRMHGGALMGIADSLGAFGAFLNLPPGHSTTTIESKTNFFSSGVEGGKVVAVSTPLHVGRSTIVFQTRIERDDGKLVALVTQTQMVLAPRA